MSEFIASYGGGGFARDPRFSLGAPMLEPALAPPEPEHPPDPLALARAEGFAAGRAEALAEAEAQRRADDAALMRMSFSFERLDADLAESLRQKLHETVVALCEETLRPLALDSAALALRVERAVAMFARADDERLIRLNPADLAVVSPLLPEDWQFAADPALAPGAIRVESGSGGVEDGPEQWRAAIIEALRLC
ncbi:MAG: flagellar biosynthesis protein [Sphingomonadales bacterium]|nr:flagellar biosynthesis protein [Sphingomonadales bacterium]